MGHVNMLLLPKNEVMSWSLAADILSRSGPKYVESPPSLRSAPSEGDKGSASERGSVPKFGRGSVSPSDSLSLMAGPMRIGDEVSDGALSSYCLWDQLGWRVDGAEGRDPRTYWISRSRLDIRASRAWA